MLKQLPGIKDNICTSVRICLILKGYRESKCRATVKWGFQRFIFLKKGGGVASTSGKQCSVSRSTFLMVSMLQFDFKVYFLFIRGTAGNLQRDLTYRALLKGFDKVILYITI